MNFSQIKNLVLLGGLVGLIGIFLVWGASWSNTEIDQSNSFRQKSKERTAFYDKVAKVLSNKSQIAVKVDSSFIKVVNAQMTGQKLGDNVTFAWIQQANPTATFSEVKEMYADLSRAVEGQREGFFEQEKVLQDIDMQHNNHLQKFPGVIMANILGRKEFNYEPIQSDATAEVMRTGRDNNTKLDL